MLPCISPTASGRAASGIEDLTFRMCRSTFATLFEGDVRDLEELLGHHSPEFSLKHYRKPRPSRQFEAVEAMERRLKLVVVGAKEVA